MDLNNIPMYQMMSNKLEWLSERQKLVAQNIANATTPNYKEVDLKPASFKELLVSQKENESSAIQKNQSKFKTEVNRASEDTKINGNTVSLEKQMMQISETSGMDRQLKLLMKKQIQFLKIALRGSS